MFETTMEVQAVRSLAILAVAYVRPGDRTRGSRGAADLATIVIITAILATAAIAIGAILVKKFTDTANDVPTK